MSNKVALNHFVHSKAHERFLLEAIPEFMSIYFSDSDEPDGFSLQQIFF